MNQNNYNFDVKVALIKAGVKQYEVARALGISEYTLCRWLRKELAPERKETILATIQRISRGC